LRGKGETILLVDDEIAVRELTKAILTTHGYNVLTANDGAEALSLCSQNADKIRLVLMDMMMPVMDGATTMKKLNAKHPSLRFVAISGLMKAEKLEEEVGLKDVNFLLKPFNAEKLLSTIHRVISGQTGTIPSLKMAGESKPSLEKPLRIQEPSPLAPRG
jgi:CheY-like chemotaxis protein